MLTEVRSDVVLFAA